MWKCGKLGAANVEMWKCGKLEAANKNHDFSFLRYSLKFMVFWFLLGFPMFLCSSSYDLKIMFFVLIGCANVSELLVMVFHGFYWFLQWF